jgi:hypothetical protein
LNTEIFFKIKENSYRAKLAAFKLKKPKMAMVWGSTILLFGVTKSEFLENKKWLRHELEHIRQFKEYGFFKFITLYIFESLKNGYQNNHFEIAARAAEEE